MPSDFPLLSMEINCTICQEASNKALVATKCGHLFHKTCVSNWLARKTTCPTCRARCTPTTLLRIYVESSKVTNIPKEELTKGSQELQDLAKSTIAGKQWLLSCFAPFECENNQPYYFKDQSFEEVRADWYAARKSNTQHLAQYKFNRDWADAKEMTMKVVNMDQFVQTYLETNRKPAVPVQTNAFASSVLKAKTPKNIFGQSKPQQQTGTGGGAAAFVPSQTTGDIFGQQQPRVPWVLPTVPKLTPILGGTVFETTAPPGNIFGQSRQSIFLANPPKPTAPNPFQPSFRQQTNVATSGGMVAQPIKASKSPFNGQTNNQNEPKDIPPQQQPSTSQGSRTGSQNGTQKKSQNFYSRLENLELNQVQAFRAQEFELGSIPNCPPPREFCFD